MLQVFRWNLKVKSDWKESRGSEQEWPLDVIFSATTLRSVGTFSKDDGLRIMVDTFIHYNVGFLYYFRAGDNNEMMALLVSLPAPHPPFLCVNESALDWLRSGICIRVTTVRMRHGAYCCRPELESGGEGHRLDTKTPPGLDGNPSETEKKQNNSYFFRTTWKIHFY